MTIFKERVKIVISALITVTFITYIDEGEGDLNEAFRYFTQIGKHFSKNVNLMFSNAIVYYLY